MRVCTVCSESKSLSEFHRKSAGRDGLCEACISCVKARNRARYVADREQRLADAAIYRTQNVEKLRDYRVANKEKAKRENKKYRDANRAELLAGYKRRREDKAHVVKLESAAWRRANPHVVRQQAAKRRASKSQATPVWANAFFVQEAYDLAVLRTKITGFDWHVDHQVPLKSKIVCGLHCEFNLAVIPAAHNLSKSNRYWPDMPGL